MAFRASRRGFLMGGVAVVAGSTLGGLHLVSAEERFRAWVGETLALNLPGVRISQKDVDLYADVLLRREGWKAPVFAAAEPLIGAVASLSENLQFKRIAAYERRVVSDFLLDSNFFELEDPRGGELTYYGPEERICARANPFAEFLD